LNRKKPAALLELNIEHASQREFEDFVFNNGAHSDQRLMVTFDPQHNARRFIKMFRDAGSLLDKYDVKNLERGCWVMFGPGDQGNLTDLIWNHDIPIEVKEELISSMYFMYRDVFIRQPLGHACEMWWDGLAYAINPMGRAQPSKNHEHRRIQNAMFETLSRVLYLDSSDCQGAALHGLNHVLHPENNRIIKTFIDSQPDLTKEAIEYALLCSKGLAA
jgi:hypothetical protein